MNLIIVTGHPGSGKSSISRYINTFLNYELLSKDWFKEKSFSECGFKSPDEKAILDMQAEKLFISSVKSLVEQDKNLIVDKWLQGIEYFTFLKDFSNVNVIVIRLFCNPDLSTKRYNERIINGSRPMCFIAQNVFPITEETVFESPISIECMTEKINRPFKKDNIENYYEVDTSDIQNNETKIKTDIKTFVLERIK